MELSLPVFTTKICRGWVSNTQPSVCETNALTPRLRMNFIERCLKCSSAYLFAVFCVSMKYVVKNEKYWNNFGTGVSNTIVYFTWNKQQHNSQSLFINTHYKRGSTWVRSFTVLLCHQWWIPYKTLSSTLSQL